MINLKRLLKLDYTHDNVVKRCVIFRLKDLLFTARSDKKYPLGYNDKYVNIKITYKQGVRQ